jgi:hypothetical protein
MLKVLAGLLKIHFGIVFMLFACGAIFASADFEQVWFSQVACAPESEVEIEVSYPAKAALDANIEFVVKILTSIPYQATVISFDIVSDAGESTYHAVLETDLKQGRNQVVFQWSPSDIPAGYHQLQISVDYSDLLPPTLCVVPFDRVSAAQWKKQIDVSETLLGTLGKAIQELPENQAQAMLQSQLMVARNTVGDARTALQNESWENLSRQVGYLNQTCKSLHAGLVFGKTAEIASEKIEKPSLEKMEIRSGAFFAEGHPVFLFGREIDNAESAEAQLQRLNQLGLNATVQTVAVNETPEEMTSRMNEVIETARAHSVALAVQFDQETISGAIMDQWPEVLEPGFTNLAHASFAELYTERLLALAAGLTGKPMVLCASIARVPQFQFLGEPVREQFVRYVQERYPDRIDLNRLWRSHLFDYDEITIGGDYPEHSYQNRRAFQYEWQSFQRGLITDFFAGIDQQIAEKAPDLPIMLTLPNNAFMPAETRTGVNRETAATLMDINGCNTDSGWFESLYAINYPAPHVYYALMHSYTPDKPILNLKGDIVLGDVDSQDMHYKIVQSSVWESVMSGASGLVLPAGSAVFAYPEALQAFITAAQDVNRLAPVVVAFQQAPAEIGIVFSEASKIMDDGVPHLESAQFAFEGAAFAGYCLRFITESQIARGALQSIKVLILPDTLSVSDETFEKLSAYVEEGGSIARVGTPIPYNERGLSRSDVIRSTANTVLVRGMNLPTEYLHAMDAAQEAGTLPEIPRPINPFGYPLEGVRSRSVTYDNEDYLYIINLRKEPVNCYLTGVSRSGYDLIRGREVEFPRELTPLEPMMIRMDRQYLKAASATP